VVAAGELLARFRVRAAVVVWLLAAGSASAELVLGPERFVQANGADIVVPGYSVPSFVDWNNDGLKDLLVGQGGNYNSPAVRVYLNQGSPSEPVFSTYSYVKTSGGDPVGYVGHECSCAALGLYPRAVYWDGDARKDLLVGQLDGTVMIYRNVGTDAQPVFDDGTFLQALEGDQKVNIDVGDIAAPTVVDWDNDGLRDLLVGQEAGGLYWYPNAGSNTQPDFQEGVEIGVEGGGSFVVAHQQSTPVIMDLDGDGRKDLLTGNLPGQLLFYPNVGTDAAPLFGDYSQVEADGAPITVDAITGASPRSRPFVTDWNGDGLLDVLIGAGDGKIHLYQGVPDAATMALLAVGALGLLFRRRSSTLPRDRA